MHRWRNHSQHVAFYHIKQIDSVALGLFSNRSQKTSWFGRNISDCTSCAKFWSHLWSLFTTWKVYLDPKLSLVPSWLDSSVGRALHRYRRGHGFKSRTGLNFFKVSFQLSSVVFIAHLWSFTLQDARQHRIYSDRCYTSIDFYHYY